MDVAIVARCVLCMFIISFTGCSRSDRAKAPLEEGSRLRAKIDQLIVGDARGPASSKLTSFSERELNAALKLHFKAKFPKGITEPQVKLLGDSRVAAHANIDVDEFKRKRGKRSALEPLNLFGGKIPVVVEGDLVARNGRGQFKLASAEINGIPLPNSLVRDLLAAHTRSRHHPDGFNLDRPFDLPASIREVIVNPGEAIVVQ